MKRYGREIFVSIANFVSAALLVNYGHPYPALVVSAVAGGLLGIVAFRLRWQL